MNRGFTQRDVPAGVTPVFRHLRDDDNIIRATTCDLIEDNSGETLSYGVATVSPRDNPSKKIGRAISVGRAMKRLNAHR